jgi:hypothetical protein
VNTFLRQNRWNFNSFCHELLFICELPKYIRGLNSRVGHLTCSAVAPRDEKLSFILA